VLLLAAILVAILTVVIVYFIKYEFSDTNSFEKLVSENYILSVIMIIAVCAIQVMVALVPGELVELAAGYAFGAWLGALYCIIGIILGSVLVILLTRKYGRAFVESLCSREKIDSISWINEPKKLNFLAAVIFFIPGTPKDLLTYAIGLTKMSIPTYIAITTLARFPSIIISTLSGGALGDSNLGKAIVFFTISAATGILGFFAFEVAFQGAYLIFGRRTGLAAAENVADFPHIVGDFRGHFFFGSFVRTFQVFC
jgi:uncharacterized membrane protein YdjX (TVP38/TMEM64 family)